MTSQRITALLAVFALFACVATTASADPLPGENLKFLQLPLNSGVPVPLTPNNLSPPGAPFPGHDELSTAWANPNGTSTLTGNYMADDFSDKVSTPVVHVQWWGSYMNPNAAVPPQQAQQFMITFENDIPAGVDPVIPNSHPDQTTAFSQIVTLGPLAPKSGTFTEKAVSPPGVAEPVFQYNAELALPFNEQANQVYWLKIVALDPAHFQGDPNALQWGWHDRDWSIPNPLASAVVNPGEVPQPSPFGPVWHFQDDAVSGRIDINTLLPIIPGQGASVQQFGFIPQNYVDPILGTTIAVDGPLGIAQFSKDLAFGLYTIPEPSSVVLLSFGAVALMWAGWKRRRAAK